MTVQRRYVFGGSASGVSAHIRRPEDKILPVQAASAIPVIGGCSESKVGPGQLGTYLYFASAETTVSGDFIDAEQGIAITRQQLPPDEAPARTTAAATVTGLTVGNRVTLGMTRLGLVHESARVPGGQSPIRLAGNTIDGVVVDGQKVKIVLEEDYFNRYPTLKELTDACTQNPEPWHWFTLASGFTPDQSAALDGTMFTNIVKSIEWEDQKRRPDGLRDLNNNGFHLPGFGSVYFGEMFVSKHSKRLTLARFQLGSDDGGRSVRFGRRYQKPALA